MAVITLGLFIPTECISRTLSLSLCAGTVSGAIASYSEEAVDPASVQDADLIFPDVKREPDDIDTLLSVMGFASADSVETHEIISCIEPLQPGEAFWQWLVTGCRSGGLIPIKANSRIYLAAGYVFLRALGIFHQYLLKTSAPGEDKARLQKAFEQLGHYRQDKGTMYTCHLYQNEQREGKFQKMSGYLVLANKIFKSDNNPVGNQLLIVI